MKSSTASMSSLMQAYSGALGSLDSQDRAFSAEPRMMGVSSAGEAVEVQRLADFHLDELEQLFVVDLVSTCSGRPERRGR